MGAFSFTTADGHKCIVGSSPEGFHLSVLPKEPPFEAEFLDVFYLGLRHVDRGPLGHGPKLAQGPLRVKVDGEVYETILEHRSRSCTATR